MLTHPAHPSYAVQPKGAKDAARALGVQFREVPIRGSGSSDFDAAFKAVETVAMKLTGHRTRSVFQRYAIVEEGMLQERVPG